MSTPEPPPYPSGDQPGLNPPGFPPPPPPPPGAPPPPGPYAVGPPTSGLAIAALIVGIVSIIGVCCYAVPGLVLGIVAIVLGQKAKSDIRASQGQQAGEGMAKAGFIMGIVSVVLSLLAAAIFVALFALGTMSEIPTAP